jgi:hypothetical protein
MAKWPSVGMNGSNVFVPALLGFKGARVSAEESGPKAGAPSCPSSRG